MDYTFFAITFSSFFISIVIYALFMGQIDQLKNF